MSSPSRHEEMLLTHQTLVQVKPGVRTGAAISLHGTENTKCSYRIPYALHFSGTTIPCNPREFLKEIIPSFTEVLPQ